MDRNVKALGVLDTIFAAMGILAAMGVLVAIQFLRPMFWPDPGPDFTVDFSHWGVVRAIPIFLILASAPFLIGGIGLLKRQPWARTLVLILGFSSLVFVPSSSLAVKLAAR